MEYYEIDLRKPQSDLFSPQIQLANLKQNIEEILWEYVDRADALVSGLLPSHRATVGMEILGSMSEG